MQKKVKLAHMSSKFIEIFDTKVLYAIDSMVYIEISRQYGKSFSFLVVFQLLLIRET